MEVSSKLAQEDLTIEFPAEDQTYDGVSTDVGAADKTLSMIDDIVEKFNLRYAKSDEGIGAIISDLDRDQDLQCNLRDSSDSAYEAAVTEWVASRVMDRVFDGAINSDAMVR